MSALKSISAVKYIERKDGKTVKKAIRMAWTLLLVGVLFLCGGKRVVSQKAQAETPYGWELISSYTTYFNEQDVGRSENIAIAASLIDGVTMQAYGEFSFNGVVGKRTEEAGFRQAKIIVNGEYVQGVGGGVCQVSTTLYNAALKAGQEILEYHPHSLRVGYISPSRDAMVSSSSDLRFWNRRNHAIYLSAKTFKGGIRVCFYGKKDGYRYEITANLLEELPPPTPIVKMGEVEGVLRQEKSGARSEAYLECYFGEKLVERKRIRVDEYQPIQGIIVKKNADTTKKMPSNTCFFRKKLL